MRFTMERMPIGLSPDQSLRVVEVRGATLRVVRGRVWMTQEGSVDDVFLDAGCGHTFQVDGSVLISVESAAGVGATIVFDTPLSISEPVSIGSWLRRFWSRSPAPLAVASNVYEGI